MTGLWQCQILGASKLSSNLVTSSPKRLPAKLSFLGALLFLAFGVILTCNVFLTEKNHT